MTTTSRVNRIKRALDLIEANAKQATPGPWALSHSHVIKFEPEGRAYDVACRPWEKHMVCYGLNPHGTGDKDMRYIATVHPQTMLRLVEDIRAELELT